MVEYGRLVEYGRVHVCPVKLHYSALCPHSGTHVCPSIRPMYAWRDKGHKALCPLSVEPCSWVAGYLALGRPRHGPRAPDAGRAVCEYDKGTRSASSLMASKAAALNNAGLLREQHTDRAPRREPGVTGLSGGGPPCRVQSRHGISLRRHCPAVVPRTTIEAEQFVAQYTHIETLERHIGHAIAASSTAVLCDAFTSFFATLSLR